MTKISEMSNQKLGPYVIHAGLRNKDLKTNPAYVSKKLNKRTDSMNLALKKMQKNTVVEDEKTDKVKLGGKTEVILKPTLKDTEVVIDKKDAIVERVMEHYRSKLSEATLSTQKMGAYSAEGHAHKFIEHNTKSEEMHGLSMALDNYRNEHKRKMSSHEYKKLESHSKAALIAAHTHLKHAHEHLAHFIKKAPQEEVEHLKKHLPAFKKYLDRKHLDESLLKKPSWITPKKPVISAKLKRLMTHQKQNSQNIMRLNKEDAINELGIRKGRLLIGHVHRKKGGFQAVPGGQGPVKVFNNQDAAVAHVQKHGKSAMNLRVESQTKQ